MSIPKKKVRHVIFTSETSQNMAIFVAVGGVIIIVVVMVDMVVLKSYLALENNKQ